MYHASLSSTYAVRIQFGVHVSTFTRCYAGADAGVGGWSGRDARASGPPHSYHGLVCAVSAEILQPCRAQLMRLLRLEIGEKRGRA